MVAPQPPAAQQIDTDLEGFVGQLSAERDRLANAACHLERSNKELKSAILDQGDADDEFKKAIGENIVVLARYKARIERLDKEIEELLDMQCVSGAAAGSHGGGPSSMDMQPEGGDLTEAEASRSSGEVANAVAVAAEAGVHLRADPVPSPGQDTDMEGMYL